MIIYMLLDFFCDIHTVVYFDLYQFSAVFVVGKKIWDIEVDDNIYVVCF
jgi:hypothetical protein